MRNSARHRWLRGKTYCCVSMIAGINGVLGGALLFWALEFHPLGGAVCAPIPSVVTWLVLVHFMHPPTWRRSLLIGASSPFVGAGMLAFLPIGLVVAGWYVTIPMGMLTALLVRQVLIAYPQAPVDYPACIACGYNLTGNTSERCPECGTPD